MSTDTEGLAFIVIRGLVALAIVCAAFYCFGQGVHFLRLPQAEAQQIHIHFVGVDITATGLGAVILAAGVALCLVAAKVVPKSIETKETTEGKSGRQGGGSIRGIKSTTYKILKKW